MKQEIAQLPGVVVGELAGTDGGGRPLVRIDGGPARPAAAVWMADPPDWKASAGRRVVLGFVDGAEDHPVVLGLLDPPAAPPRSVVPDTVRVAGNEEVVIECGRSKITLRADGRIEIRGGHLISRSSGPNKIKGGSVHIN